MRPTSAAKHSSVVSLLTQGYPHHQIPVLALVLSAKLTKNLIPTRKTIMVVVLPNFLLMINSPLFVKSHLESLIMLFKLPNSLTTLSPTLFILKLLEMH
jgi:hypothetical protein